MLYSCTHIATVGVNGLTANNSLQFYSPDLCHIRKNWKTRHFSSTTSHFDDLGQMGRCRRTHPVGLARSHRRVWGQAAEVEQAHACAASVEAEAAQRPSDYVKAD